MKKENVSAEKLEKIERGAWRLKFKLFQIIFF